MADLATLDRAAVFAYEEALGRRLADPDRLKAVYGAQFKAQSVRERLDTICTVARSLLHTDGSAVTLVTDKEQVVVGLEPSSLDINGSLAYSYCQYTVNEEAPFAVSNAHEHALVCTNLATTEQGLVSYLGMPVVVHGFAVGALCVWNMAEREWVPSEVTLLTTMAVLAADTLNWEA